MNQQAIEIIKNNFSSIVNSWAKRIYRSVPSHRSVPIDEIKTDISYYLEGIIYALEMNDYIKLNSAVHRMFFRENLLEFSLMENQRRLSVGKKLIHDLLMREIGNENRVLIRTINRLDACFFHAIFRFSEIYQAYNEEQIRKTAKELAKVEERAKYLEELKIENEKLDNLMSGLGANLTLVDKEKKIIWANQAVAKRFGDLEELKGKYCYEVFWNREDVCENCTSEMAFVTGEIQHAIKTVNSNSNTKYYNVISAPVKSSSGEINRVLEFFMDVTAEKTLEQKLHASEENIANIIRYAPDAIISFGLDGKIELWNKGAEDIFGYSSEEILGQSIEILIPVNLRDEFEKIKEEVKEKGFIKNHVMTCLTKFGKSIIIDLTQMIMIGVNSNEVRFSAIISDITKRKEAEDALRQSEARYRFLVENAPLGIVSADVQGRIIDVNPMILKILGSPSVEATRSINLLNFPPLIEAGISDIIRKCLQTGETIEYECPYISKWEKYSYLHIHITPMRDIIGKVSGIQAVVEDIAERKQAEEELRKSEANLSALIENTKDGIFSIDKNYKLITFNSIFKDTIMLAFDKSPEVGMSIKDILPEKMHTQWIDFFNQALSEKRFFIEYELEIRDKTRYYDISFNPITTDGSVTGVTIFSKNITERKKIENELKLRLEELSILDDVSTALQKNVDLESIMRIILIGATAGEGLGFNRSFLFLISDDKKYLEGKMALGPSSPEEASRIWRNLDITHPSLKQLLDGHKTLKIEENEKVNQIVKRFSISLENEENILIQAVKYKKDFNLKREREGSEKNSELFDVLETDAFAVVPLSSTDEAIGILLSDNAFNKREISSENVRLLRIFANHAAAAIENSWLHQELKNKIDELEELNRNLQESQEKLMRAERLSTVGVVAANLAHEIRNPLVSIGGFARALYKKTRLDEKDKEYLRIIADEVVHLENIVSDVLNYARSNKPKMETVSVDRIITETMTLVSEDLKKNNIKFIAEYNGEIPDLWIDPDQIKQVFLNIYQNGIYAMLNKRGRNGGGELKVSVSSDEDNVIISISDTGYGIPREHQEKIFEPFFTTKSTGSGLGLPICLEIVRQHGGSINFKSQEGEWTMFTLYLPSEKKRRLSIK